MHPELLRAVAREHDAARLAEARAGLSARSAPPRASLLTQRVRRYVGSRLLAAGTRVLAGCVETTPIQPTSLSTSR